MNLQSLKDYLIHNWQSLELGLSNIAFAILLLPQMIKKDTQVNKIGAKLTGYVLLFNAIAFWSLSYYYASVTSCIVGLMWNWLSEHRTKKPKKEDESSLNSEPIHLEI